MARIAVLLDQRFEDAEYAAPARAFAGAGHELVHVGAREGGTVKGKDETEVRIDRGFRDARPWDFDALLILGEFQPETLRRDYEAVEFVREFMDMGRPVLAICRGPRLLVFAGLADGKRLTGWKSMAHYVRNAGAEFVDKDVVEDGNLLTCRHPGDMPACINASLSKLDKSDPLPEDAVFDPEAESESEASDMEDDFPMDGNEDIPLDHLDNDR